MRWLVYWLVLAPLIFVASVYFVSFLAGLVVTPFWSELEETPYEFVVILAATALGYVGGVVAVWLGWRRMRAWVRPAGRVGKT